MKTKTAVRIISFCVAAVMICSGFLIKEINKSRHYSLELKNNYSKSFEDFNSAINNISLTLDKLKYASTSAQVSRMATKLLAEAEVSKSALAQMPQAGELSVLNKFLSQVGNYAFAVSKTLTETGEISDSTKENIYLLADTAKTIADITNTNSTSFNNGEYWAAEIENSINNIASPLAESLNSLEDELADFPKLIYDGPYSDHILEKEPQLIKDNPEVTVETALSRAIMLCDSENYSLSHTGNTEGHIPTYSFSGENITVSVSRKGGEAVFMRKTRAIGNSLLKIDQAREKAKRYLGRIGKAGFKETYYTLNEGILIINYAFVDGETICYTDLIKLGVAMDNGEIVLYEAGGYITNHKERAFESAAFSPEQARGILNKSLNVTGTSLALIPTSGGNEARCYEFACTTEEKQDILVYINVASLKEEEILILLKADGGTLVK